MVRGLSAAKAEIGRSIKAARERAGLRQSDAAARAGIDEKRWQRLEYGDVNPTLGTLLRIARALDTDIATLTSNLREKR